MLEAGLAVTVNSGGPAYFGSYINANLVAIAEALDLSRLGLVTLARNSFSSAFLSVA
jgi:adenosine deaminase